MQFRLWTIFYVMALLGAALATFGTDGIWCALFVPLGWGCVLGILSLKQKTRDVIAAILFFFLLMWLNLPASSAAREASRRAACKNNLKQIVLAVQIYHDTYGTMPPACLKDENGNPAHSWRVLILPFIEGDTLHHAYRFDEPWDGPNNSKFGEWLHHYTCPAGTEPREMTQYFAVTGPQTAFPPDNPPSLDQFSDGASNTILILEVHNKGIHWMEPRDISFEEAVELLSNEEHAILHQLHAADHFFSTAIYGSTHLGMADGRVFGSFGGWTRESAEAMLTIAGGEKGEPEEVEFNYHYKRQMKWHKVFCFTLFVLLALLPAPWVYRLYKNPEDSEQKQQPS